MKISYFILYFLTFALCGCQAIDGMHFPVTEDLQRSSLISEKIKIIRVNPDNIIDISKATSKIPPIPKSILPPTSKYVYKIGPGDVLGVNLWQTPEGPQSEESPSIVVSEDGNIYYPFAGEVEVTGLSIKEVRKLLAKKLSTYIKSPQVDISVKKFNAHRATLIGSVDIPGQIPITDVPINLLDTLNIVGLNEKSDLSNIILRRDGRDYRVNLNEFISRGAKKYNPQITPNDVIIVNQIKEKQIFTFGEIGVGEIKFSKSDPTLTSILAKQRGLNTQRADSRGVFVFREAPNGSHIDVYQFAVNQPAILVLAQAFEMRANDVLFVTSDPITRWNDTITKILSPVITTIRAQAVVEAVN